MLAITVIVGLVGLLAGAGAGFMVRRRAEGTSLQQAEEQASRILAEAETRQKELLLEAKEETLSLRNSLEAELRERRTEAARIEQRLTQKEENLDRKVETLERREQSVRDREAQIEQLRSEAEEMRHRQATELERVANLTVDEARQQLMAAVEVEIRDEASRRVREIEKEVEATAGPRARKILATAIQRYTSEVTAETTVSVVPIPSDDMKGRIIGREGRNIRAIEAATGVDLIIDDTPDAVTVSAFDPVRREIARQTLSMLVQDGRIHPTRIEEMAEKAKKEVDASIKDAGEQAIVEASCPGLHPEIVRSLGRLKYRYSYGQNQLMHAVETANLAAMIAHELGANVEVARRGGLLHDIGKSIDHEVEGTHAHLGGELAKRHGVHADVVHCIEAHHEEVEPGSVEAIITIVADAISGSRPGARRESLEHYLKRLEALEAVANGFPGVEKSFAIQAGREVRIIVKPEEVDDLGAARMAKEISKRIQESLDYPGQVKVTVIRERRSVEYAK